MSYCVTLQTSIPATLTSAERPLLGPTQLAGWQSSRGEDVQLPFSAPWFIAPAFRKFSLMSDFGLSYCSPLPPLPMEVD